MKTFHFDESNGSATITLSAENFDDAKKILTEVGLNVDMWRCEDEEGEEEDE